MPKTASKRAQARKEARIYRAHQTAALPTAARRIPAAAAARSRPSRRTNILRDYPWATMIFVVLLVGFIVLVLHQQRIGPWAPPGKPQQATCNTRTHICDKAPFSVLQADTAYTATIKTSKGTIVVAINTTSAPSYANSFVFLAEQKFYNGLDFWKVERLNQISPETNQLSNIDLIQGGKGGDAQGGPGYTLKPVSSQGAYTSGVVAMANAGQFFINTVDNSSAVTSSNYPIIGNVTSGLSVAKSITRGDKILSITITSKRAVPTPTVATTPTAATTPTVPPTQTP